MQQVHVVDHGTHLTVEDDQGRNLGVMVGHGRFFTRSGADGWAEHFRTHLPDTAEMVARAKHRDDIGA